MDPNAGTSDSGGNAGPSFGIVILNWNNAADTIACLEALRACDPRPERVVVVDNGSADESLRSLTAWANEAAPAWSEGRHWLTILPAGRNLGFAGGTNVGISHLLSTTGVSHVVLLNNDAFVSPRFFADLGASLSEVPDAGVMGTTIREHEDPRKVWYAGGTEYPLRALVRHESEVPGSSAPQPTDFVTGCVMVISRRALESVGLLAECYYPAYFEDGDYCHRARDAGFSVIYAPLPVAYHKVGATVRAAKLSLPLTFHKNRLRVIYVRRNYRGATRIVALAYLLVTKPVRALADALKGQPREGWAVLRGAAAGFAASGIGRDDRSDEAG